jgi:hypothetical protein
MCANRKNADPAAPPNPRCSRPPCLGDFPRHPVRTVRLLHSVALAGRSAELLRWAGGFLGLLLQFGSSALAASCSARERVCRSHNPVLHPQPSARCGTPASHRVHLTHAAYASPSLGLALRFCLHGSTRLILAVHVRAFALPKSVQLMCADREAATPAAPPNPRCSRPPSRCDFPRRRVPPALPAHTPVLAGRPAERHRWASPPSHLDPHRR